MSIIRPPHRCHQDTRACCEACGRNPKELHEWHPSRTTASVLCGQYFGSAGVQCSVTGYIRIGGALSQLPGLMKGCRFGSRLAATMTTHPSKCQTGRVFARSIKAFHMSRLHNPVCGWNFMYLIG